MQARDNFCTPHSVEAGSFWRPRQFSPNSHKSSCSLASGFGITFVIIIIIVDIIIFLQNINTIT